ncbi:MAG: hypothetical protein ISS48_04610 [Candidatus Aenigmarchaeota archaeon]|nr:hypothetical protein [Candidatus Aenigmarchaeota archaeon]
MVKSPLQIILELLTLIVSSIVNTFVLIFQKLVELFESLTFIAQAGIAGLLAACFIGGLVIFLLSKFIFKNTKSLFQVLLIYVVFVLVLVLVFYLTTPISRTPLP